MRTSPLMQTERWHGMLPKDLCVILDTEDPTPAPATAAGGPKALTATLATQISDNTEDWQLHGSRHSTACRASLKTMDAHFAKHGHKYFK